MQKKEKKINIEYQENIDFPKISKSINNKNNSVSEQKSKINKNNKSKLLNLKNNIGTYNNSKSRNNLDNSLKYLDKEKNNIDDIIGDIIINGKSYQSNGKKEQIDNKIKDKELNLSKNGNKKLNNKSDNVKYNEIIDKDSKINVSKNSKNIFNKKKKRSNSYNNNMDKIFNKNLSQNKKKDKEKIIKIPYLNYLNLNQINKLNYNNNKKNIILYNNIIKPFNHTKTIYNNSNLYLNKKIILDNNNFEKKNNESKKESLYNGRKLISDISESKKNKKLIINKSCIFENFLKLRNINYISRNKSVYVGSCFACDLGFSISRTGYSPMTFSPYNRKKREEGAKLPINIVYEQYTRHKKKEN